MILIQYFLVNLFVINTTTELQYKTEAEIVPAHNASLTSFYSIYSTAQRLTTLLPNNNYSTTTLSDTIIATIYNIDNESFSTTNNKDSTEDLKLNSMVAVQPKCANGFSWFGKIIRFVESDYVELLWLHKSTNITKFFYLNDTPDIVHTESIICNGVEFKPVYGNK
jgi:hypothetical protein